MFFSKNNIRYFINTACLQEEEEEEEEVVVVVVVEPVGIVGNSERSGELSTSPQAGRMEINFGWSPTGQKRPD